MLGWAAHCTDRCSRCTGLSAALPAALHCCSCRCHCWSSCTRGARLPTSRRSVSVLVAAEDKGILDDKGNLVEEDDVVLENILAVSR